MESKAYQERIRETVRAIPPGKVASYGQIAHLIGRPNGARFVGAVMRSNAARGVPCHRVVFSDGGLCEGDAFGMPVIQRRLLEGEGVLFCENGKVDMKQCRWDGRIPGAAALPVESQEGTYADIRVWRRGNCGPEKEG